MKLKVSNYRPNRIIERDPNENTYAVGDDKFPTIAHVDNLKTAQHIVRCVNSHDELLDACKSAMRLIDSLFEVGGAVPLAGTDSICERVRTAIQNAK